MSLQILQTQLGYTFANEKLLIEALTHKSYKQPYNNERLEFLGDAILDLIVAEYLYMSYPNANEGILSKARASIVNEEGFTRLAIALHLGDYLYLSHAEINNHGRTKPSLLANAFEAIMGAIYLEVGLETVKRIVLALLESLYANVDLLGLSKDYKTVLQEYTQAHYGELPEYRVLDASGPDHDKTFVVGLFIEAKEYARAQGKSKKQAQQDAALTTLKILLPKEYA
ncbi:MAG: ribonuclease III [Sulfuricurvum sp. PC08-66]|nr:MAG: ribonuclease III [Sulfuricurvum sp. PC08-66]